MQPSCFEFTMNYIMIQSQVIFRLVCTRTGNACLQPVINWAPVVGGGSRSVFDCSKDLAAEHPLAFCFSLWSRLCSVHIIWQIIVGTVMGFVRVCLCVCVRNWKQQPTLHNFRFRAIHQKLPESKTGPLEVYVDVMPDPFIRPFLNLLFALDNAPFCSDAQHHQWVNHEWVSF